MRAAYFRSLGAAKDVLEVSMIPKPIPKPSEVLVQIHSSGVNPSDCKRRAGGRGEMSAPLIVPHSDGSGIIVETGNNVPKSRIGERVWLWNAQWNRDLGTAAEYISIDSTQAVELPHHMTFEEGACIGIPAVTAHRCLFSDGTLRGKSILVAGGTGSVGSCAIQLAKWGKAGQVIHMNPYLLQVKFNAFCRYLLL